MKLVTKTSFYLLTLTCIACDFNPFGIDTNKDLGTFDTKVEAQNRAVNFVLSKYSSLPENEHYKVLYSFRDAKPGEYSRNALWYHKELQQAGLEVDIHSGMVCRWDEVDKHVLEQATQSTNNLIKIDSLAKPNQPLSQCL